MVAEMNHLKKLIKDRIVVVKKRIRDCEAKLKNESDRYVILKKNERELEELQSKLDRL